MADPGLGVREETRSFPFKNGQCLGIVREVNL